MKSFLTYTFSFLLLISFGLIERCCAEESFEQDESLSQDEWTPASSWEANTEENMEKSLLSDIEEELGTKHRQATEARIAQNKEGMRSIFESLPKNEYGKLGHSSVRYMLHRYFVQKHGWFIDGLFTEGDALNSSSPVLTLMDRVPMYVQGLFERRLGGRGFGLHEMAVLVAIVENSVHQEAQRELNNTFKALRIPLNGTFGHKSVKLMVERYMTGFILKLNMTETSARELQRKYKKIATYYPTWPVAQEFFDSIRAKHMQELPLVYYEDISRMVAEIVDSFGIFQGRQCQGLKQQMMGLEKKSSAGCVGLADFYDKGLKADSNWMFIESPEYLRQLGALDEMDPQNPRVLSANYMLGPNSCLQPSGYYMVCCHNECDDILGQLEVKLAAPTATPSEVLLALPASSTARSLRASSKPLIAPRLVHRLEEVAAHHEGRVPIHGRLFAQWLHHVYPHECPYPHLSGTKSPEWMDDYEGETGKPSILSDVEMKMFVRNNSASHSKKKALSDDIGSCAPWQDEEELFAPLPMARRSLAELEDDPHLWQVASACAFMTAVATTVIHALRVAKSLRNLWYHPKMLQV
jgi:hypothetical protein